MQERFENVSCSMFDHREYAREKISLLAGSYIGISK